MSEYLSSVVCGILYCAVVGSIIGNQRDMAQAGFFLGLFCGPLGWIVVACIPKDIEPNNVPKRRALFMNCKCGSKLNIAFLPSGPYKCQSCGHHLDIQNDPAK